MTVRGRRALPAFALGLTLLAGCTSTVSGAPAPQAAPAPTTMRAAPVTTTVAPLTTTTTTKPKPKPTTTTRSPAPRTTHAPARPKAPPPKPAEKSVTYLITGSGTVSVRYLSGGSMRSAGRVSLPWRKTVPLSGGRYEMTLTTGSDANIDEQVSVEGVVVGTGHNEGAGSGSFSGSY